MGADAPPGVTSDVLADSPMAWLERHPTSGRFHLCVRWNGKRKRRSLSTDDTKAAEAIRLCLEENVALLERGRLELPPAADIMTFLLSDGKLAASPKTAAVNTKHSGSSATCIWRPSATGRSRPTRAKTSACT